MTEVAKQVRWLFAAVAPRRGGASWDEHEGILEAIVARDAGTAARLSAEHSRHTQELYVEELLMHPAQAV